MKHLDLFSGIGGFAIAVDEVFPNSEHIFCDNNKFCQQVLKKHWPKSKIYGDIREITKKHISPNARSQKSGGLPHLARKESPAVGIDIITGGFPCQPFSQAGKRKGTDDDRHLWPEMLRVIRLAKPKWIIAENVRGLLTIEGGMVFEQVCLDLEAEGYEVQAFIIPACAVNAPHRRDRIWFVAHSKSSGDRGIKREIYNQDGRQNGELCIGIKNANSDASDTDSKRGSGRSENGRQVLEREISETENARSDWERNWLEVATELCGVDDGIPAKLDGFELTKAGHRNERLKSLGNAIVPQVAIEIMKSLLNKS